MRNSFSFRSSLGALQVKGRSYAHLNISAKTAVVPPGGKVWSLTPLSELNREMVDKALDLFAD
jgi:hypothetical protein